ncbi:MAG: GtrA family protein [Lentisphaerae bacterium]|nr:GtrA family protein [Lentisphaerota bacterium]
MTAIMDRNKADMAVTLVAAKADAGNFRELLEERFPGCEIVCPGDIARIGTAKSVIFSSCTPETVDLLPAMLEKSASLPCDVLVLTGKKPAAVSFVDLFYRLFLRIFCGIKNGSSAAAVQIWKTPVLQKITPPETSADFPANLLYLKKVHPRPDIALFPCDSKVLPPPGNSPVYIFKSVLALYRLGCIRFTWLHQLVLYGIIGLLAAAVDYGIFALLTFFKVLPPEFASLSGNIAGFLFTFSGNTFYNFKKSDHVLFRFVSYLTIAACGMAFSTLLISFAQKHFNVYLIKAVLTLIIIPLVQFILNKKITYRQFRHKKEEGK